MTTRATTAMPLTTIQRGKCGGYRCDCSEFVAGKAVRDYVLCATCPHIRESHRKDAA